MTIRHSRRTALAALALASMTSLGLAAQDEAKPATPPPAEPPKAAAPAKEFVLMTTSKGDILLELDREKAPLTVENFMAYVNDGFYDGTIFHRVIPSFMIQGGGFTEDMKQKPTRGPIKNEWQNGLRNDRGTIAMARLPQPDTATSQFFINVQDNLSLNGNAQMGSPGYAVFGKVIDGLDVVDAIKLVRTSRMGPHEAVPVEAVVIVKTAKLSEDEAKKHIEARRAAKTAPSEGQSAGGADTGKSAGGNGEKKADAPGK